MALRQAARVGASVWRGRGRALRGLSVAAEADDTTAYSGGAVQFRLSSTPRRPSAGASRGCKPCVPRLHVRVGRWGCRRLEARRELRPGRGRRVRAPDCGRGVSDRGRALGCVCAAPGGLRRGSLRGAEYVVRKLKSSICDATHTTIVATQGVRARRR